MARSHRPRTSEERTIAREKLTKRQIIMMRNPYMRPIDWHYEELHFQLSGGEALVSRGALIRYVEFANQIPSSHGSLNPYDAPRKEFLSRKHFMRAIDLAKKGSNALTTTDEELAEMSGVTIEEYTKGAFDELEHMFKHLPKIGRNDLKSD